MRIVIAAAAISTVGWPAAGTDGIALAQPNAILDADSQGARLRPSPAPSRHRADDAGDGRLLFRTTEAAGSAQYLAAPRVGTWVSIDVNGIVARTTVTQRFYNPTEAWLEGIYVFPLPDGSAVDALRMIVGDRLVEGRIREKVRARREYERARNEGRVTVLAEQRRADVFRTSVANVAPGVDIIVELEYQALVDYDDGGFSLRFPLVVAPRYESPNATAGSSAATEEDGIVSADASGGYALTPGFEVVTAARGRSDVDPVELVVELDAGVALRSVDSPSHEIEAQRTSRGRYTVALADGATRADRDFVLEWRPRATDEPLLGLHEERSGDHTYQLLMLVPPAPNASGVPPVPREVIFVIDTSGSMAGRSLREAKAALRTALARLGPRDTFNVIEFDTFTTTVFDAPVAATEANRRVAARWLGDLAADGGTEMSPALSRALDAAPTRDRLRQVVFITDGQVVDEEALLALIRERLGESRLFTVGIGSAPNGSFMRRAAAAGRGTFVFIGTVIEVGERMSGLLAKLERPAVTDIEVDYGSAGDAIIWPERVPDLYAGEPVIAVARIPGTAPPVRIRGNVAGEGWEVDAVGDRHGAISTSTAASPGDSVDAGIAKLWAARTVESLTDRLGRRELDELEREETRAAATELAVAFGLVSRFTSLVAVDTGIGRPFAEPLAVGRVAVEPPAGWRHRAALRRSNDPRGLWSADVARQLHSVDPAAAPAADLRLAALPNTDAGSRGRLVIGAALLLAGLLLARSAAAARLGLR